MLKWHEGVDVDIAKKYKYSTESTYIVLFNHYSASYVSIT